ncbi:hypothetical protein BDP27DRAFT_1436519 [Rhodocollybia butyracea]|uniref:Uncharacterized protein n=1 Tax=Rhodocollybia butyracea TaxID=206335 RepID=A0A9P5P6N3_9AGAR|nr:hypothetical protein BDP27DRAFT_1436519 [Rhodocollybia butyracea]
MDRILITVQRNFVHRHSNILQWEEEVASNVEESPQEASEPPAKRKKVSKNQGKKAKGHDFWSMVDEWYGEKMKELGTKITDPGWKQLLEDFVNFDEPGFIGPCPCPDSAQINSSSQSPLSNTQNQPFRSAGAPGSGVLALCHNI